MMGSPKAYPSQRRRSAPWRARATALVALAAATGAGCEHLPFRPDKPVDYEGRMERLAAQQERSIRELEEALAELRIQQRLQTERMDNLETGLAGIEARMEMSRVEREAMREEVVRDVTTRLRSGAPAKPMSVTLPPADLLPGAAPLAELPPGELYRKAFDSFVQDDYGDAIQAFRVFLETYPQNPFAHEAQYRLGEAHFALEEYPKALIEFAKVPERYPESTRAADSLLRMEAAYRALGRKRRARETLDRLLERYPDSAAAVEARERQSKAGAPDGAPTAGSGG